MGTCYAFSAAFRVAYVVGMTAPTLFQWRKDFEADEAGKLPQDLKRGVLSEDGLWNLLSDYGRLKEITKL